jgi:hypothetical protein
MPRSIATRMPAWGFWFHLGGPNPRRKKVSSDPNRRPRAAKKSVRIRTAALAQRKSQFGSEPPASHSARITSHAKSSFVLERAARRSLTGPNSHHAVVVPFPGPVRSRFSLTLTLSSVKHLYGAASALARELDHPHPTLARSDHDPRSKPRLRNPARPGAKPVVKPETDAGHPGPPR